jgi:hypothetical protein
VTLTPALTPLDRRVLKACQGRQTQPARIAKAIVVRQRWESRDEWWQRVEAERETILQVLRGLEHFGLVRQRRGGWWMAR